MKEAYYKPWRKEEEASDDGGIAVAGSPTVALIKPSARIRTMARVGGERLRGGGYSIVYTTFGDRASARRASLALVQERLAACTNAFAIDSFYRWKGKVLREPEVGVMVKTRSALVPRVVSRLRELHPYENPCAVETRLARGRAPYLDWIDDCTTVRRSKRKGGRSRT